MALASAETGRDGGLVLESLVLAQAKVRVPLMRPPLVERRALLDELASAPDVPVVLITAPPGYGKTTLIAQWAERDPRPFAYVHLDEADNDPVVMLAYVTLALDRLGMVDSRVKDALRAPEPALGRAVLPGIANDMAGRDPFVLVLDDVHVLRNEQCLANVAYLSESMPEGSQMALAGRADLAIPLASLRVAKKLLEIRGERMAFRPAETAGLLRALGVDLDGESVDRLVRQTEGWPAGLYLAALYLRDCDEPAAYINRFRGDHRNVADYFMTEVLARQPDEIVEFLRRTSILERLSGEMCDAVLERSGSAALLAEMERSIPFLVPLDEHREWYRYHILFAELLVGELYAREPELIPELHLRAAEWYESQGFVDRMGAEAVPADPGVERLTPKYFQSALQHNLAGGAAVHAGDLLATHWRPFAASGRLASLDRMLADFTDEQIASHPPLALTAAWVAYLASDGERTARLLAHASLVDDPGHPEWASSRSSLALLRAGLGLSGMAGLREDSEIAYALETESPSGWYGMSRVMVAVTRLLEGDREHAAELLRDAAATDRQYGDVRMTALAALAVCDIDGGHWETALSHARAAFDHARRRQLLDYSPSSLALAVHARVLAHECEQSAAREIIRGVVRLVRQSPPQWWQASLALLLTAEAQLDVGDMDGVERTMRTAREVVSSRPDAGPLAARLARVQTAVGLRLLSEPLSASEMHVLEQLPSGRSLSEIAESIYLSRNTVKTHVRAIYRKLGVASREEAVDLGRNLGLIG